MRQKRIIRSTLFDLFADHQIGREFKAISGWLEAHSEVLTLVATDLGEAGIKGTGRQGLAVLIIYIGQPSWHVPLSAPANMPNPLARECRIG